MFHSKSQDTVNKSPDKYWTYIRIRWFLIRFAMVLYDILAVNLAYWLALVVRFYVGGQINVYATWCFPAFQTFAPYYTVCCIAVFACFRLYSGIWKYAGINDMNRIIGANAVTFVIQVAGTLLFVTRMPITYYLLGAVMQFMAIAVSRFSFRLISTEKLVALKVRNQAGLKTMIVGVGETARIVRKGFEGDQANAVRTVCMFDCTSGNGSRLMDGIPVVRGMDRMKEYIRKYNVEYVLLADSAMSEETGREIKRICREADVDVQDFSGCFQVNGMELPLGKLLQYTRGPVEIITNGMAQVFADGEQAVLAMDGKYNVQSVSVHDGRLSVEVSKHQVVLNDLNEDWVQKMEEETGETISFF